MNDFPFLTGVSNPGGLMLVEFTPIAAVSSFPAAKNAVVSQPIIFAAGQRWYTVYGSMTKKGYDDAMSDSDNGDIWKANIEIFYPYDSEAARTLMANMNFHQFILRLTDNNGFRRLVGTPWQGLKFGYRFATGDGIPGTRGYALSWKGDLTRVPPTYTAST